jgi:hypothetical protein
MNRNKLFSVMPMVSMMPMMSMVSVMPMMSVVPVVPMMLLIRVLTEGVIWVSFIAFVYKELPYCWPYPWLWFRVPLPDSIIIGDPPLFATWTVIVYWRAWGCPTIWRKWLVPKGKLCTDYSITKKLLWEVPNIWFICWEWELTKNCAYGDTSALEMFPCW